MIITVLILKNSKIYLYSYILKKSRLGSRKFYSELAHSLRLAIRIRPAPYPDGDRVESECSLAHFTFR